MDDENQDIFEPGDPHFQHTLPGSEPDDAPDDVEEEESPVKASQTDAELERLRRENEQIRREQQELLRAAITNRQPSSQQNNPPAQPVLNDIDWSTMPDPTVDPDKHRQWMEKTFSTATQSVGQAIQQSTQSIRDELQRSQRQNDLAARMSRFRAAYPDVAKLPDSYIGAAATTAGVTGDDPEAVIFERTYTQLQKDGLVSKGGSAPNPKQTGVNGGGGPRRRAKPKPENPDEKPPQPFIEQITDHQSKMGLF